MNKNTLTDKNAGGFLEQKAKAKVGENEKELPDGKDFGPISYEWAFMIFKDKYQGQERAPVVRIFGQLGEIAKAIYHELEPCVRNPECVWG